MKKEQLAFNLIEQLIELARAQDKELIRLKKILDPQYTVAQGMGPIEFHLGVLKELIEEEYKRLEVK